MRLIGIAQPRRAASWLGTDSSCAGLASSCLLLRATYILVAARLRQQTVGHRQKHHHAEGYLDLRRSRKRDVR